MAEWTGQLGDGRVTDVPSDDNQDWRVACNVTRDFVGLKRYKAACCRSHGAAGHAARRANARSSPLGEPRDAERGSSTHPHHYREIRRAVGVPRPAEFAKLLARARGIQGNRPPRSASR
jgi:hypothetical protein